jgi:iron complex outermembrane receptor protein
VTFNVWDAYVAAQTIASNLDLKGKFDTGPFNHTLLVGGDYWYLDKNIEAFFGTNPTVPALNIFAPNYTLGGYILLAPNSFFPWRENWWGLYGQDMISFADDKLHLLLGGRYDWAEFGSGFSPQLECRGSRAFQTGCGDRLSKLSCQCVQPARWGCGPTGAMAVVLWRLRSILGRV